MTINDAENGTVQRKDRHTARNVARGLTVVAATAGLVVASSLAANAATDGSTNGHVAVSTAISLTGLTSDFTLTGVPGATASEADAVAYTVETNNLAGYSVSVQATTATLAPETVGNPDSIPISALSVTNSADTLTPVSSSTPVVVHTQGTRSAQGGDDLTNDYSVAIPFVNSDTYSVTLNYIAATL